MYTPSPKQEAPRSGFDIGHFLKDQEVEVWPENWPVLDIFSQLSTQWRVGTGGPIGLDYNVMFRVLDMEGLSGQEWRDFFDDLRIMESAALEAMRQSD